MKEYFELCINRLGKWREMNKLTKTQTTNIKSRKSKKSVKGYNKQRNWISNHKTLIKIKNPGPDGFMNKIYQKL